MADAHPICRSCLKKCVQYKSLYKQGMIICDVFSTLGKLLSFVTNLSFEPDDGLPENICVRCIQKLTAAYIFKKTVLEGNDALRNQRDQISAVENPSMYVKEENISVEYRTGLRELPSAAKIKQVMDGEEFLTVEVSNESHCFEEPKIEIADSNDQTEDVIVKEEEEFLEQNVSFVLEDHLKQDDEESTEHTHEVMFLDVENEQTVSTTLTKEGDDSQYTENTENQAFLGYDEEDHHNTKSMVTKRRKKEGNQKPFSPDLQCRVCGKQLKNKASFKYHMKLHPDATPFICSFCGQGFKTRKAYIGHVKLHKPKKPHTCEICSKSYGRLSSLRAHMLSHTGEKPFKCDICGKGITQNSGLKKHMLVHTGERPYICDVCGRTFRFSSNLNQHKRYNCNGEKRVWKYSCEFCNKNFKRHSSLRAHENVHRFAT